MVNVCIPTLNSYEELDRCIHSLRSNTVDKIVVLDNGLGHVPASLPNLRYIKSPYNYGVAKSWNLMIGLTAGIRIICNDDVLFEQDSVKQMVDDYDDNNIISPAGLGYMNVFSCFLIPEKIIQEVGLFDEKISPNYGYFEDNDYFRRLTLAGFGVKFSQAKVQHLGSSTMKHMTPDQERKHHTKFNMAKKNYIKKWGGEPGSETRTTPQEL